MRLALNEIPEIIKERHGQPNQNDEVHCVVRHITLSHGLEFLRFLATFISGVLPSNMLLGICTTIPNKRLLSEAVSMSLLTAIRVHIQYQYRLQKTHLRISAVLWFWVQDVQHIITVISNLILNVLW